MGEVVKKEYVTMVILSLLLFSSINVDGRLYFLLAVSFWLLVCSRYKLRLNQGFYHKCEMLALINFFVYICSKVLLREYHFDAEKVFSSSMDMVLLFFYVMCLIFASCHNWVCRRHNEEKKNEKKQKVSKYESGQKGRGQNAAETFFKERYGDAEQIKKYLERFSSIGIEGEWGSGKTVLMNYIAADPDMQKQYIFITIHLLSVDFDDIQDIIIREIGKTLDAQGIFSSGVPELLKWMKEDGWISKFIKLFVPDGSTYTDAMANLKKDLELLGDRKIVMIYEDIDRIQDTKNIRRLFSLSENLAGISIKFIYEFDEERLQSLDEKFSREYVEKYIPYVIRLTPISIRHIFEMAINEHNLENLNTEDLKFLFRPILSDYRLQKEAEAPGALNFRLSPASIRKVNIFLDEIDTAFERNETYRKEKNRRVVIAYFMWKHFFYDIYKEVDLDRETSITEQLLFRLSDGTTATIWEILFSRDVETKEDSGDFDPNMNSLFESERKVIWEDKENWERLLLLSMFGYCFKAQEVSAYRGNVSPIVNEDPENLKKRCRNDEIDRLIRSLAYSGKSSMTNLQFVYKKMCDEVFKKTKGEWVQAYYALQRNLFANAYAYDDNHTIFYWGIDPMLQLFKAFDVSVAQEDEWLKLLEFYFMKIGQMSKEHSFAISNRVLQPLNFVDLKWKSVYLTILKAFNTAIIKGHLNNSLTYRNFLEKYLSALSYLGYIETYECEYLRSFPDSIGEDIEQWVFDRLKERLEHLQRELNFSREITDDIAVMLEFIEKNRMLYKTKYPAPKESDFFHVEKSSRSVLPNQETVDRLRREYKDGETLKKEMLKEYRAGKLTAFEMERLWKKQKE